MENNSLKPAIKWWNSKTLAEKLDLLAIHPVVGKAKDRINNLTESEIEEISVKEINRILNI